MSNSVESKGKEEKKVVPVNLRKRAWIDEPTTRIALGGALILALLGLRNVDLGAQSNAVLSRRESVPTATLPMFSPVPTLMPTQVLLSESLKNVPLPATSQYTEEEIQEAIEQGIITPTPEAR